MKNVLAISLLSVGMMCAASDKETEAWAKLVTAVNRCNNADFWSAIKEVDSTKINGAATHHLVYMASKCQDGQILAGLVAKGFDPNTRNGDQTPLHRAALAENTCSIRNLAKVGANIDAQDSFGNTPLMNAVSEYNLAATQGLLQLDADTTITDFYGETALDKGNDKTQWKRKTWGEANSFKWVKDWIAKKQKDQNDNKQQK